MKSVQFEYGQGYLEAQLPDSAEVFIPGETVPDPPPLADAAAATRESILNPVGLEESYLDGALSIREVYGPLYRAVQKAGKNESAERFSSVGLLWAMAGGEIAGMRSANTLTVRGEADVQYVFDESR